MLKVILWLEDGAEVSFELEARNIAQVVSFMKINYVKEYKLLQRNEYSYTIADMTGKLKAKTMPKGSGLVNITEYDLLVISKRLEGAFVMTAIGVVAAGIAAAAGSVVVATVAGVVITAGVLATAIVTVVVIGILVALMFLLTPNMALGDSDLSSAQKDLSFNGIRNVNEQGGSVPYIFGNCLCGGVIIASKLVTTSQNLDVLTVATIAEGMDYPARWLKVVPV